MRIILTALAIIVPLILKAQAVKYKRSSLYTLIVTDADRKYESTIKKTFLNTPIPDKFNDHNISIRLVHSSANDTLQDSVINSFLKSNNIAKNIVAKWFNRDEKGCFDMQLVAQRGFYNASQIDVSIAKKSKRGIALISDAGESLIANTFILISDFRFISKEELAKIIDSTISTTQEIIQKTERVKRLLPNVGPMSKINKTTDKLPGSSTANTTGTVLKAGTKFLGKGYVVITTSYLYQLDWNDSIANLFYKNYWMNEHTYDEKRKKDFEKTDLFRLKYLGSEKAWADLQSTIYTSKSEEELVTIATVKSLDAVIAKLQKKHPRFRTVSPIHTIDPLTAKIGKKEGLEPGDKYNVFEQVVDENGITSYKSVGLIKVDKSQVWDNRYMATIDSTQIIDRTLFKKVRGKKFHTGMLIKQK